MPTSDVHPKNARSSIVSALGIFASARDVQLENAAAPIVFTFGTLTLVSEVQ